VLYNNEEGRMVYHMTTIIKYLTHTKQAVYTPNSIHIFISYACTFQGTL
jgi:hypothetical protein